MPDGTDSAGRARWENGANGDGPVLGREFEIADILAYIRRQGIANVVWLTADVHYCAAHYYDPQKAQYKEFAPFWEFVSGPLNAGSFGPNALDNAVLRTSGHRRSHRRDDGHVEGSQRSFCF